MKTKFSVEGMFCAACVANVERSVKKLDGVTKVMVSLVNNSMIVEYNNEDNVNTIINAVNKAGYHASIYDPKKKLIKDKDVKIRRNKLIASLILMFLLLYVSMGHMIGIALPFLNNKIVCAIIQMCLVIPICILNSFFFIDGFNKLFKLKPNMSSLIAVASSSAIIYGVYAFIILIVRNENIDLYFESAGTILTLVSLGKYIEFKSKGKTTKAIDELVNLVPENAYRVINDKIEEVYLEEVNLDDILIVKNGKSIPVDGIIVSGDCEIDESMITGESKLQYKEVNDNVISSTICVNGSFKMKATSTSIDSTIAKIISIVDEASNSKAKVSRLADKVSLIFVPSVFLISILAFVLWLIINKDFEYAFRIAISVLVISCPCALGLATPLAIMIGTGVAAKNSILFKDAESLEGLHNINSICLDKTGTITSGKLKVLNVNSFDYSKEELLKVISSLEFNTTHPISKSILEYYNNDNYYEVINFENLLGKGLSGEINQIKYYVGNKKLMEDIDINTDIITNNTVVYLASDRLLGYIELSDVIKDSSLKAINTFKEHNLKVYMVTGDSEEVSKDIAQKLGINYYSNVTPVEKGDIVTSLKQDNNVCFVGDGINDAIALTNSDVGIAIGAGTDVAISSANVVLMKNDLTDVTKAMLISKKTINNIKLSLFWAFFYNVLCIPIACGALSGLGIILNPMIASLAMSLSSVSVVLNSLRLNHINKKIN